MTRPLAVAVAVVALLALPAVASAQVVTLPDGSTAYIGPPTLGGRLLSGPAISNGPSALYLAQTPVPSRFSVGGGSRSEPPQVWLPSGSWGGVNYPWPVREVTLLEPAPRQGAVPARGASGSSLAVYPQPAAAGQTTATLVVQFPAAAEVWVGGKKVAGDPATEWTLTSPAIKPGESHTFDVKGRWKSGGKTFEATRSVSVTAGERNRAVVVSGTEVK